MTTNLDSLFWAAKAAYETWERAVERQGENEFEEAVYRQSIRLGVPSDPSVLSPPAPQGTAEAAKAAYVEAFWQFTDAVEDATDDLPDPDTDGPQTFREVVADWYASHPLPADRQEDAP